MRIILSIREMIRRIEISQTVRTGSKRKLLRPLRPGEKPMRFRVTKFRVRKEKNILIWSMDVEANDRIEALEKAGVQIKGYHVFEIRERLPVARIERNGVI